MHKPQYTQSKHRHLGSTCKYKDTRTIDGTASTSPQPGYKVISARLKPIKPELSRWPHIQIVRIACINLSINALAGVKNGPARLGIDYP